jgi:cardiolipin synthase C
LAINPAFALQSVRRGRLLIRAGVLAMLVQLPLAAWGDAFRILSSDGEAVQARADLIRKSCIEISAAYYAMDDGQISTAVQRLLCDAARRGVRVRLLVDGQGSRLTQSAANALLSAGVEARVYHPIRVLRPEWINRRMHDKLLEADGEHLIVGSRNLEDHHFGLKPINYVDCDAYILGNTAVAARDYFTMLWDSRDVVPLQAKECRDFRVVESRQEFNLDIDAEYDWFGANAREACVCFLQDSRSDKKRGSIRGDVLDLIDGSRTGLVIETPYPVFSAPMMRAILAARSRGVAVRMVTNSLTSTDHVAAYADYQNHKKTLLRAGVELWEYAPADHLHAKSMVVDGSIALIGSYNFDIRSDKADLEIAVAVADPDAATELAEVIEQHMADAYRLGPDGKPLGGGPRHPGAGLEELKKLRRDRLLAPFIRRLL